MSNPLAIVAAVAGAGVVVVLALRWLRRAVGHALLSGMPRLQHQRFVERLRDAAFADPLGVVAALSGNNAACLLNRLWAESRNDVRRAKTAVDRAEAAGDPGAGPLKEMMQTEWPSEPLRARAVSLSRGWSLVVVTMPPPERTGEPYFIGVAVHSAAVSGRDAEAARRQVRYFVLNKWGSGRPTDFVEHTTAGRELTYNVGTDPRVDAFAEAVDEKLRTITNLSLRTD